MKRREPVRLSCILFSAIFPLIVPILAAAQEKIAFRSYRDGNDEIYIMNPDGSSQTRLTNNALDDLEPSFSHDGGKIVFTRHEGGPNYEIYVIKFDGTGSTKLTSTSESDRSPSFSPDDSQIVFASDRDGNSAIWLMNADGSNPTKVPNSDGIGAVYGPVFSPDGTKIAFTDSGDSPNDASTSEIFIINIDGSNRTPLTDTPGLELNSDPKFSPDGSKIVFSSTRDSAYYGEIYVMNVNGSGQTRLTTTPASDIRPTYSPDGMKIAFDSAPDGVSGHDIYVMNSNGSDPVNLTPSSTGDLEPSWADIGIPPTITAATGVTRVRNAGPSNSLIATVDDVEDPPGTLDVTVNGGPSATVNGITITNIFVDAPGNVSADIAAVTPPCGETLAGFTLRVTDSSGRFSQAFLVVSTTPVPPPGALPGNAFSGVEPGPDGRLYGVTYNCGNTNDGTLYVYNPSTQFVTELHSFNGALDGSVPYEELVFDAVSGKFYGVTYEGGPSGVGTVFTFAHATHVFTTIRSDFGGYGTPEGAPVRSNNYLYGVVRSGTGAIYRMAPDGSEFEIIHAFEQIGTRPQPLTLGPDGMLYGLTLGGGNFCPAVGTGCGTVFRLENALPGEATGFDTVYEFPVTTQSAFINPVRGITYGSDGRLYGATFKNVFRLDPQGTNFQTIFTGGSGNTLPLIEGLGGILYITDYFGGPDGAGSVFSINKDGTGLPTTLLTFNYDTGSNGPYGRLYQNAAGIIFGTTEYDPDGGPGTVFVITQEQIFDNGFEN